MNKLHRINGVNPGQTWARTRWNTHGSGAAFDRKKQFSLSSAMKAFAEGQDFYVISFLDTNAHVSGRLLQGRLGEFAKAPDDHHLIIQPLNLALDDLPLCKPGAGSRQLGIIFIEFKTRKRLCLHATAVWGCRRRKLTSTKS
jgi:hypothetical protein